MHYGQNGRISQMSTLYLIRHGQASFGGEDYDNLSNLGRRQARMLGDFLLRSGIRFDACWSGTLKRQRQTAAEVRDCFDTSGLKMPDPEQTIALNEYDYESVLRTLIPVILREEPAFRSEVDVMMSDRDAFQGVFARVMRRWASGCDDLDPTYTWSSFCGGVAAGIRNIMENYSGGCHVAVFTSGGPISAVVGTILELGPEKAVALSWQLVNASITRLKFSRGRIGLDTFNEKGHLERPGGNGMVTYR